jgi:hypothetical protein
MWSHVEPSDAYEWARDDAIGIDEHNVPERQT